MTGNVTIIGKGRNEGQWPGRVCHIVSWGFTCFAEQHSLITPSLYVPVACR